MKTKINAMETYKLKCPVCDRIVLADDNDTGESISFTPCEHLVLHFHSGGFFDAFNNMSPEIEKALEYYKEAYIAESKASDSLKGIEYSEEDYRDLEAEYQEIFDKLEESLKDADSHMLIEATFQGGSCSGPSFSYADTFIFKLDKS